MQDYEKLGAFYLGRRFDPDKGEIAPENILYDAKDLTTHRRCHEIVTALPSDRRTES